MGFPVSVERANENVVIPSPFGCVPIGTIGTALDYCSDGVPGVEKIERAIYGGDIAEIPAAADDEPHGLRFIFARSDIVPQIT